MALTEKREDDTEVSAEGSFSYCQFFSVLLRYYGITKEQAEKYSYKYLMSLYQEYPKRVMEMLGISPESEPEQEELDISQYADYEYPEGFFINREDSPI